MTASPDRRSALVPRRTALRLGGRALALGALALAGCARGSDEPPEVTATSQAAATLAPSATPRPEVSLPDGPDEPNAVVVQVLGDPPQDQRVLVEYAATLARDYCSRQLGFYLDGPVLINVVDMPDLPVHAATFLRDGATISAITVNVGQRTWELETPLDRAKVVAHEYFHVLQNWLRGGADTSADPLFLVEGAAEYAGYATVIDAGQMTLDEFRDGVLDRIRGQRVPLRPLDQLTDDGPLALTGYQLAALAVDRLVGDQGIVPLARYTLLRRTLPPPAAFESVFGRTLEAFYFDVALWRRAVRV